MKTYFLIALTALAFLTTVAFKSFLRLPPETATSEVYVKKQFSIRCSPLYIPTAGEDVPVLPAFYFN